MSTSMQLKEYQSQSQSQLQLQSQSRSLVTMSPTDYNGSTITSSPSSSIIGSDSNTNSTFSKKRFPRRRQNPPRPPSGSLPLPTIDASPFMIPNIYIKRTSKASHSIAGPAATKRLFSAQHKICSWIWNQIHHSGVPADINLATEKNTDINANANADAKASIGFMVVGHGVPYQLLQDHVDCAWNMLNDASTHADTDEGEVVECNFYNDTKSRNFDSIKIRKRNNTISQYPLSTQDHNTDQDLYLAVMNRLSTTFGTILQTQPPPAPSSAINKKSYWKKDILNPMSCWRVSFKRGFVFPPSATSTSFDSESNFSHGGKVKGGMEFWTGPPIVELIPAGSRLEDAHVDADVDVDSNDDRRGGEGKEEGSSSISGEEQGHGDGERKDDTLSNANFVRVTLQGIPSVFWQEQESDLGIHLRKDDMVPLSLVFEARFEPEARE